MSDEESYEYPAADVILGALNTMAQGGDFELGVTLTVPGGMVSGMLVSRTAWLASMLEDQRFEPLHETLLEINTSLKQQAGEDNDDDAEDFLHLLDARIYVGDGATPRGGVDGLAWRGKLTDVSGWAIASIEPA